VLLKARLSEIKQCSKQQQQQKNVPRPQLQFKSFFKTLTANKQHDQILYYYIFN